MRKYIPTALSFLLMLAVWAALFGNLAFAAAFIVLLALHEMGHYLVARKLNMDVGLPIFTPLGAFINMRKMPDNAWQEALMAYGGPFLGTVAATGALLLGAVLHSPVLVVAAQAGFFLNLFNLIPLSPLDGGRISMAIDRRLWVAGVALLIGAMWFLQISLFGFFMLFLIASFARRDIDMRALQARETPEYFQIGTSRRVTVLVAYLGLVAFLALMLFNLLG
jgi:Zn-dependent protease